MDRLIIKDHQRIGILSITQRINAMIDEVKRLDSALAELVGDFVELAGGDRNEKWQADDDCTELTKIETGEGEKDVND
jgi:hypothetical protein